MVKRSIYLVNPKFQLKFSLFVCLIALIVSSVYPYTMYYTLESLAAQLGPDQQAELAKNRTTLILLLGTYQAVITILVFIVCIFMSHKIAGPIFKLKKFLTNIANGHPTERLYFRKGDQFQDVADDFNQAFSKIQETYASDFAYISEISTYINNLSLVVPDDKKPVINEINKRLEQIQDRFRNK